MIQQNRGHFSIGKIYQMLHIFYRMALMFYTVFEYSNTQTRNNQRLRYI